MIDSTDKQLLNLLQWEFPLDPRPFALLAAKLGIPEAEVLERVRVLKEERLIRQISAIFDSWRIGYQSCLVAARTPAERIEAVAAGINRHPGVSHNYERDHSFNLWFTLTLPRARDLQAEVDRLQTDSGALSMRLLPTVRLFKIGVKLDVAGGEGVLPAPAPPPTYTDTPVLTERDILAVRALQQDLPVESLPFQTLAAARGMEAAALLDYGRQFLARGQMRRFAAVLNHRRAGFVANGMGVWNVPAERVDAVGRQMAAFAAVSHCYQRPCYPDWPYNLFTMIHGKSTGECEQVSAAIAAATGIRDYSLLYSTREFKKSRVLYFEW